MIKTYDTASNAFVEDPLKIHDATVGAWIDAPSAKTYDTNLRSWVDRYALNRFILHSHTANDGITPGGVIILTDGGFLFGNGNVVYTGAEFTFITDFNVKAGDVLTLTYKDDNTPHGSLGIGEINGSDLSNITILMSSKGVNDAYGSRDVTYTFDNAWDKGKIGIRYWYHDLGVQNFELCNVAINGKKCKFVF